MSLDELNVEVPVPHSGTGTTSPVLPALSAFGRLAEERQQARLSRDWAAARRVLRQTRRGAFFGWTVQDTPEGLKIFRQS